MIEHSSRASFPGRSAPQTAHVLGVRSTLETHILLIVATIGGISFIPLLNRFLALFVPTTHIDTEFLGRTFLLPVDEFRPEPLERYTFLFASVLIPPLLLWILYQARPILLGLSDRVVWRIWLALFLGSASALIGLVNHFPAGVFLSEIFPPSVHPVSRVFASLGLTACVLAFARQSGTSRISGKLSAGIIYGTLGLVTAALFLFIVSNTTEVSPNFPGGTHFDAVLYSTAQVVRGKGLLVDLSNQYGLYPQFLEPIFRVTGLDVFSFTMTMWVLMCASFVCIFSFLRLRVQSQWIALLGLFAIVHYGYLSSKTWVPDEPYFQYHPIRFLFPCIALCLFGVYIAHESELIYYSLFVLSSISVLWNPDTGVVVFGTWVILLAYREFVARPLMAALRNTGIQVVRSIIIFGCVITLYSAYTLVRYHTWPNWADLTINVPVFYRYGGMMLPLPENHPWMLVISIYVLAMARSLWCMIHGTDFKRGQTQLAVAVLGIGLFGYYQGRSHDNNLTFVIYPALILVALYADELEGSLDWDGDRKLFAAKSMIAYGLLLLLCFPVVLSLDVARATRPFLSAKLGSLMSKRQDGLRKDILFISKYAAGRQRVPILSYRAGVLHAESGTESSFAGPGLTEMLWRTQADSLQKQIEEVRDGPLFFDVRVSQSWALTQQLTTPLTPRWQMIDQNLSDGGNLVVLQRLPDDAPGERDGWLLPQDPSSSTVVHVRSSRSGFLVDDEGRSAGAIITRTRSKVIGDLMIEVLVNPRRAQEPWATLISTHPGKHYYEGFVIHHVPGHDNAYVTVFGNGREWITGPEFILRPDVTSYLCVILHYEMAEMYVNGNPVGQFPVPGGLASGDLPVAIGNWQNRTRPLNGLVDEVYVRTGVFTLESVLLRWRLIHASSVLAGSSHTL